MATGEYLEAGEHVQFHVEGELNQEFVIATIPHPLMEEELVQDQTLKLRNVEQPLAQVCGV